MLFEKLLLRPHRATHACLPAYTRLMMDYTVYVLEIAEDWRVFAICLPVK